LSPDDLIERVGVLPTAKLSEIEDAIRLCEQPQEWTPATAAKFSEIRETLRRGGLG
jgi:mRNA interferase MazF